MTSLMTKTKTSEKSHKKEQDCLCPACQGLQPLQRPRFFAGQLLSEAELNSEQAYVLAKNRLHNRYLHGWGVVCGLEVICHECEGWVTVKPGYAIDPCGEDIIVNEEHDFNIVEHIQDCLEARRRRVKCDPISPARKAECRDDEEQWCLTLAYEEKEVRPVASLQRSCGPQYAASNNGVVCEPTRICEQYRLDLIEAPEECCADSRLVLEELLSFIRGGSRESLPTLLDNTLLSKVTQCLLSLKDSVTKKTGPKTEKRILAALTESDSKDHARPKEQYQDYERFRRVVRDLYRQNPPKFWCPKPDELDEVACEPPAFGDNRNVYARKVEPALRHQMNLLEQYALDCICQALLPPCPEDPCDERLILACVTVKWTGETYEVKRICNDSCRRYAGAFPTISYWLSLVPIIPVLSEVVRLICCYPVAEIEDWLDQLGSEEERGRPMFARSYPSVLGNMMEQVGWTAKASGKPTEMAAMEKMLKSTQDELAQLRIDVATLQGSK